LQRRAWKAHLKENFSNRLCCVARSAQVSEWCSWPLGLVHMYSTQVGSKRPTGSIDPLSVSQTDNQITIRLWSQRKAAPNIGGTVRWRVGGGWLSDSLRDRARGDKANWFYGQVHQLLGTIDYISNGWENCTTDLNTASGELDELANVHRERNYGLSAVIILNRRCYRNLLWNQVGNYTNSEPMITKKKG